MNRATYLARSKSLSLPLHKNFLFLHYSGYTPSQISKELHISRQRVHQLIKKFKLPSRPDPPTKI